MELVSQPKDLPRESREVRISPIMVQPAKGKSWVKKIWMVLRHKMKKIFLTLMLKQSLKIEIISYFPTHVNEIISPLADGNS